MEDSLSNSSEMTLGKGWLLYLGSLIGIVLFYYALYGLTVIDIIDRKEKWPILFILGVYLSAGMFLGKSVLNKLIEWHPRHRTIDNVASGKIKQILFWPISYPILFVKIFISEKL